MTIESNFNKASIIIPHVGRLSSLRTILDLLVEQALCIYEIILVCSPKAGRLLNVHPKDWHNEKHCDAHKNIQVRQFFYGRLNLIIVRSYTNLYPGHARNVGMRLASSNLVAFLDSNTLPDNDWLKHSLKIINLSKCDVILHPTKYTADSHVGKLILAATYGFRPIQTIHGALIKLDHIREPGWFLPNVRAAEDIDFIKRLKCFGVDIYQSKDPLTMYRLQSSNLFYYAFKWYRNYTLCAPYESLESQAFGVYLIVVFGILLISYMWNWQIADWNTQSRLYAPNITKLITILVSLAYMALRGYVMPCKKNSFDPGNCTLLDIPSILIISIFLDTIKIISLLRRSFFALRSTINVIFI